MTGNITDLGMELGKMLYWNSHANAATPSAVRHNRLRMQTVGGLVAMFVLGGLVGAFGFKYVGFVFVIPLAALLMGLSIPPLLRDIQRSSELQQLLNAFRTRLRGR